MSDNPELDILVRLNMREFDRDKADLRRELDRLEQDITIGINVNDTALSGVFGLVDRLDSESANIDVDVTDNEIVDLRGDIDRLDSESITVSVDADVSNRLDEISQLLQGGSSTLEIVTTVTGGAVSFVESISDISGLSGLLEMETIMSRLQATTSEMIPDADELINGIFVAGWGESRTQIAEVLTLAQQYGVEMDELGPATENALMLADINGQDPQEILRTMVNLVRNDLVTSFDEAGDVLQTGFQEGLNIADDLLDTFNEYGTTFSALGLDAQEAMAILNAGLDNGIDNTDRIADAMREFNIRTNETTDGVGLLDEQFATLGISDLAEQFRDGTLAGDEFFSATIEALAGVEDPAERARLAVDIFGTQFEDFSPDTFITAMQSVDEQLFITEGRLDEAGQAFSDNLPDAIDRARRVISTEFGEFLDEQFNITELVDDLANDLQTFFDSMQAGNGFSASFRMSFDDNRIIETLLSIRETLSDVFFSIGGALADLLDFLPGATGDGIREALGELGTGELTFDLATAESASQIEDAVSDAVNRGVDTSQLLEMLGSQFDSAIEIGDVEQIVALSEAIDQIATQTDTDLLAQFIPDDVAVDDVVNLIQSWGDVADEQLQGLLDNVVDSLNIPEDLQDDFRAQIEAIANSDIDPNFDITEILDPEAISAQTDEIVSQLETQLDDALATAFDGDTVNTEALQEALDLASVLDESTGSDFAGAIEEMAGEAGVSLEDFASLTEQTMDETSQFVGDMTEEVDNSTNEFTGILEEAGGGLEDFNTRADTELGGVEGRFNSMVGTIGSDLSLLRTDLVTTSVAFGQLIDQALLLPSNVSVGGIGGGGNNFTTNNTTNTTINPGSPASAQQAVTTATDLTNGGP